MDEGRENEPGRVFTSDLTSEKKRAILVLYKARNRRKREYTMKKKREDQVSKLFKMLKRIRKKSWRQYDNQLVKERTMEGYI